MQLASDYILPKMIVWGDLFCKGYSADYDPTINYRQFIQTDSTSIGAPLSMLFSLGKDNWPMKIINEEYRKPRMTDNEILMISGNLDNATPVEIATNELLPYLPNGKQVVLKDMSHCGDLRWIQRDTYKHMVLTYFDKGKVDESLYKHDPVSFKPKKSFNKMAKVYYPLVLIGSLIK